MPSGSPPGTGQRAVDPPPFLSSNLNEYDMSLYDGVEDEDLWAEDATGPGATTSWLGQPLVDGFEDMKDLEGLTTEHREVDGPESDIQSVESVRPFGNVEVQLPVSTLTEPRSLFGGFEPPAPETTEIKAIDTLLDVLRSRSPLEPFNEDYLEFELQDFCIYIDAALYPNELRPLHHLNKADRFYFDGTLSVGGDTRLFVRRVPFRELPVGNYGDDHHSVGDQIWIRSYLNEQSQRELYYKIGSPSVEYRRFHRPFLWIADLAKHVIDFCDHLRGQGHRAVLHDFKSSFGMWALRKHGESQCFRRWYDAHGSKDFRSAVNANVAYIWREACGLDRRAASYHRFWAEVGSLDYYRPNAGLSDELPNELPDDEDVYADADATPKKAKKDTSISKTIVTPYIYDLFSHMSFNKILDSVAPAANVERRRKKVMADASLRSVPSKVQMSIKRGNVPSFITSIECGDVISTPPDGVHTHTQWRVETSVHHENQHVWYGLVQKVHQARRRSFDVIWLYHPRDTPCAKMKYPWKNELFLSDNCTCHSNMGRVMQEDVISTHTVHWFGDPSTSAEYFVRQTYIADEQRWATLRSEHLTCESSREAESPSASFEVGDAVLVQTELTSPHLETFVIEAFFNEGKEGQVMLRRLLRRKLADPAAPNAPANELIYTKNVVNFDLRAITIVRRCVVRIFNPDEDPPTPYDRGGVGDVFLITHQEMETLDGEPRFSTINTDLALHLRQGFNPGRSLQSDKLQGLDLFCGAGNFGRGLEDGDGIQMRWANDILPEAIHTYMANTEPGSCTPFLGSVDDLLRRALQGDRAPHPGEVQFISGGSPCPGFSLLTIDKTTDKQRKNQSLVASFASYVDLYRPHYGLLENVVQMVQARHNRDECVFSQLVSAIVGLGYQTQILFMDAWSFGAPQGRSRVFLLFTAPGLRAPRPPAPTHSHPPDVPMRRLGLMSNGQSFGRREQLPTPFEFVTAREATADLPDIQDAKPDYCIGFPDHRLSVGYTPRLRKQVSHIPTQPWEMDFAKAYYFAGTLDEGTRQTLYPLGDKVRMNKGSRAWGRVGPNEVFPTITTACGVSDARVGRINHWHQPRPITILEARRAQGFPDHEVLVGSPQQQYKLVGNSVSRHVALALGLAIREAWFGTLLDKRPIPQRVRAEEPPLVAGTEMETPAWSSTAYPVAALPALASGTNTNTTNSEEPSLCAAATPLTTPDSEADTPSDGARKRAAPPVPTVVHLDIPPKRIRLSAYTSLV